MWRHFATGLRHADAVSALMIRGDEKQIHGLALLTDATGTNSVLKVVVTPLVSK